MQKCLNCGKINTTALLCVACEQVRNTQRLRLEQMLGLYEKVWGDSAAPKPEPKPSFWDRPAPRRDLHADYMRSTGPDQPLDVPPMPRPGSAKAYRSQSERIGESHITKASALPRPQAYSFDCVARLTVQVPECQTADEALNHLRNALGGVSVKINGEWRHAGMGEHYPNIHPQILGELSLAEDIAPPSCYMPTNVADTPRGNTLLGLFLDALDALDHIENLGSNVSHRELLERMHDFNSRFNL
jgi:hypothetical protein